MKKTLLTTLLFFAVVSVSMAQTWQKFNYQGVARNAVGEVLETQAIGVQITVHSGTMAGPTVYQETHAETTNEFGLFDLVLGGGTVVSGIFGSISWGADDFFVQVEMDPAGGVAYTDMGTSQLLAVPYALYAENSGTPGPAGPAGPIGPTGPLVAGTDGQTLRHDGSDWVANSFLYNNGSQIGIGTTNLSNGRMLQIAGSAASATYLQIGNTTTGVGGADGVSLGVEGTGGAHVWQWEANYLKFGTSNSERMRIDADGRVGIGTATPTHTLRIAHESGFPTNGLIIDNTNSEEWNLYVASTNDFWLLNEGTHVGTFDEVSGNYSAVSDKRLKTNVEHLSSSLSKVMALNPTSYQYLRDETRKSYNGFLAQELQQVIPEAVTKQANDGAGLEDLLMVSYNDIIPVLTGAIQEQQVLIELLQVEIELLKNK